MGLPHSKGGALGKPWKCPEEPKAPDGCAGFSREGMDRRKDGGCPWKGLGIHVGYVLEAFGNTWGSFVESCGSTSGKNGQQNMAK